MNTYTSMHTHTKSSGGWIKHINIQLTINLSEQMYNKRLKSTISQGNAN